MTNPLPYNPMDGMPIPVLAIDEKTALASLSVAALVEKVPDPGLSEMPKLIAEDARLTQYAELRTLTQRAVEGAKLKNSRSYTEYIVKGCQGERPWMVPAITLYTPEALKMIDFPGGLQALLVPFGAFFVAIDGETQRIAWGNALKQMPALSNRKVAVIIHHGKTIDEARQGFHDLNTKEVKPNAAVTISMDSLDPATKLAREIADASDVLRDRVNMRRRQLRRTDPELMTMSGLRTAVVTTILGPRGLQAGARSIVDMTPDGTNFDDVRDAALEIWLPMLEVLEESLDPETRADAVTSAPAILAGLGCLAHHAMPQPPRAEGDDEWTVEEVLERLDGVVWQREVNTENGPVYPWDGVAGKLTPKGSFSVGGPKEVGYTVAKALEDPESDEGKRIRTVKVARPNIKAVPSVRKS